MNIMITVTLTRKSIEGKAVRGVISFPINGKRCFYATLENRDYLIAEGTYPLARTWSPKFKKLMPEIQEVPDRCGLRIHRGTKPEHSTGCVLVGFDGQANLDIMFNIIEKNAKFYETEPEPVQIVIASEGQLKALVPTAGNSL